MRELSATFPSPTKRGDRRGAFFHDAVYDVTADDNEERSAALAERVLGELGWSDDRCSRVARLIMATAGHEPADDADDADEADEAVMLDADLAVLGSEPAAYQAYVTGVRAEYGQLDDERWRTGRRAVLARLLGREPLYSTEPGRSRWERRARRQHGGGAGFVGGSRLGRELSGDGEPRTRAGISFGVGRATAASSGADGRNGADHRSRARSKCTGVRAQVPSQRR